MFNTTGPAFEALCSRSGTEFIEILKKYYGSLTKTIALFHKAKDLEGRFAINLGCAQHFIRIGDLQLVGYKHKLYTCIRPCTLDGGLSTHKHCHLRLAWAVYG